MKIKNREVLGLTPLRNAALSIAEAGLAAIDTEAVIRRTVRLEGNALMVREHTFALDPAGKLVVIGIGKCALEAGRALEEVLGSRITGGVAVDVHPGTLSRLSVFIGTHPFPTPANVDATSAIIGALQGLSENDSVLFVISGGGSTLLCQPGNHTGEDESSILGCLFDGGATIREINVLRKHLSRARGGGLAYAAYPAQVIALIISDVPGNDLTSVASGPTVRDTTTVTDAEAIAEQYAVRTVCRLPELTLLETPKDERYFARVTNLLLLSNAEALRAMADAATKEGFAPRVVSDAWSGEAARAGEAIAHTLHKAPSKSALLYGGETTVKMLRSTGKGGRNMELALAALPGLREGELVLALASDGRDNSDFAGALCDTITMKRAENAELDSHALVAAHDSSRFFEKVGDAIVTGDTGANVSDLVVALRE